MWANRRPIPTRTAACSRTLPLASDAVAFLLPVVTEHTQFCVAGIGINLCLGTQRKGSRASIWHRLERPNRHCFSCTNGRARKNNLSAVRIFGRIGISCVFWDKKEEGRNLYFCFVVCHMGPTQRQNLASKAPKHCVCKAMSNFTSHSNIWKRSRGKYPAGHPVEYGRPQKSTCRTHGDATC